MAQPNDAFGNLILSRRKGQRISIGADVVVEIVEIHGDKVRLGIRAPKTMVVIRDDARQTTPSADPLREFLAKVVR